MYQLYTLEIKLLYLLVCGQCLCCYKLLVRCLQARDRVLLITNFYKILGGAFFFFPSPFTPSLSLLPRKLSGEVSLLKVGHWLSDHHHTTLMGPGHAPAVPPLSPPLHILGHSCRETEMFSHYFKLLLLFLKQTKKNYKRNHEYCLRVSWAQLYHLGLDLLKAYT